MGIVASLILTTALPAAALDLAEPLVWRKEYGFPQRSCLHMLAYETPSRESISTDFPECGNPKNYSPGQWEFRCTLPAVEAEKLVSKIGRTRRIIKHGTDCVEFQPQVELDEKRDGLTREESALTLSAVEFPGTTGLVDFQLKQLDAMIFARDEGVTAQVIAYPVLPGTPIRDQLIPGFLRPGGLRHGKKISHPWRSSEILPCRQVEHLELEFDGCVGPPGRKDVVAAARRIGDEYLDKNCKLWTLLHGPISLYVLKSKDALQGSRIMLLPGLISARPIGSYLPAGTMDDAEKYEILSREAAQLRPRLVSSPLTESLLDDELRHLKPRSEQLTPLKKGYLLAVGSAVYRQNKDGSMTYFPSYSKNSKSAECSTESSEGVGH